jgi:hypothetical protein
MSTGANTDTDIRVRCSSHRLLHQLALGVHGATGALNVLIAAYNARRGNWLRAAVHFGLAIYEGFALSDHIEDLR